VAQEFEWLFKMRDAITGPAKDISRTLNQVNDQMKALKRQQSFVDLSLETDPLKKGLKLLEMQKDKLEEQRSAADKIADSQKAHKAALSEGLSTMASFAAAAAGAAIAVAGITTALGLSALAAASVKRNTLSAFTVLTGSKDEAKALYQQINDIADVSPFQTKEVGGMFRSLLGGGFNKSEVEQTLAGVFDVGAIIGGDQGKAAAQSIIQQMLQVRAIGKLQMQDMQQIANASGGLIPITKVAEQLAQLRHVTAKEAMAMMSAGTITATEGQAAILAAIQQTADHGAALGSASKEFGTSSLEGQLSTLQSRFTHLFEDVNIQPVIDAIQALNAIFKSDTGLRAKKVFGGVFEEIFGQIGALAKSDGLKTFLDAAITGVEFVIAGFKAWWSIVSAFWDGAKPVFSALGSTISAIAGYFGGGGDAMAIFIGGLQTIAKILGFVAAAIVVVLAAGAALLALFVDIPILIMAGLGALIGLGADLIAGFWQGIKDGWAKLIIDFEGLVQMLPDSVKTILGIHSPAAIMRPFGRALPQGIGLGVDDEMPALMSKLDQMSSPSEFAGAGGGGGAALGAGGPMSFGDISFSFGTGPQDHEQAKEYGKTAARAFRAELASLMTGTAIEAGAG